MSLNVEEPYKEEEAIYLWARGLMALPPRGGPWKLGSGLGQNPEANTALGVGWGAPAVELFES